jgi:uncharacterized protein with ParB-like and HNH nuclease domain
MKANELQINNFLQAPNVQFVIPVYQRNYDWTNTECRELLNDIISVESEKRGTHFIGSIVFIHEGTYSTSEVKELIIIDGQQRLTTINILYVALYRFAKDTNRIHDAERIFNMFLTNQYVRNESNKLKLKQTDASSVAFDAIINGRESDNLPYSNVIENFNFFRIYITNENFETILNGLNRLIFVEISLERDKDDPQRIFESLNSTGLDLSQSDLIRNFILMDLPHREQKQIFENIWNPIEENAKSISKKKSLVSEFIRDYLTLKTKKIPNKNKVYPEFKKIYSNKKEDNFLQDLENMKSLSFHYRKFINPSTENDKGIRRELEYIDRLEINVAYPFLLQVYEDKDIGIIDREELIKILKLIQSYVWRRFIVGLPTNALNKIFMTLYSEVDTEEYYFSIAKALLKKRGSAKFPRNEEVKTSLRDKDLYTTQAKNRNYLFELLENHNNREYVNTNSDLITIEHIFPQNPASEWSESLSREDFSSLKEKYLNTIANLTLSGNNGALGNKDFRSKKFMNLEGMEQGYNYSRLWLNSFLKSIEEWNFEMYNQRFEIIFERFLKVWEFPPMEIEEINDEDEQSIFDADPPTFKKLEYFIFDNTKIETDAVSQMYIYVVKELYQRNTQLLTTQDQVKITRHQEDFRSPQEVVNGWYIETNLDSNSKVNSLKRLLISFELEDELIVKYNSEKSSPSTSNRFLVRNKYWQQLLPKLENTELFSNVNPSKDHWLSTGAGISGISYSMIITKSHARIELTINSSSKELNKKYYKLLDSNKKLIEEEFGTELTWEELPDNKMSRVKIDYPEVNLFNPNDWENMNSFFIDTLPKFESAFSGYVKRLK